MRGSRTRRRRKRARRQRNAARRLALYDREVRSLPMRKIYRYYARRRLMMEIDLRDAIVIPFDHDRDDITQVRGRALAALWAERGGQGPRES